MLQAGLLIVALLANGQVRTKTFDNEVPEALKSGRGIPAREYFVPNPKNFESLANNPNESPTADLSYKFAIAVPVSVDVLSQAGVHRTKDKTTYLFKLKAGSAKKPVHNAGKIPFITQCGLIYLY